MADTHDVLQFGEFELDPVRVELRRGDEVVQVQPQVFDGLRYFLDNPGVLLTREALHKALWPGVYVADDALSQLIRKIRVALDDSTKSPRYLQTVPRRGYRFVEEVRPLPVAQPTAVANTPSRTTSTEDPVGPLFGRERDLALITAHVEDGADLVTVCGAGGMGKSHLAAAAVRALGPVHDGVVTVDLQDVDSAEGVVRAVARALHVPLQQESLDDQRTQVGFALAARGRVLCLLDDLDQLGRVAPSLIDAWRAAAPEVVWLLTVRKPLGLPRERMVELAPLPPDGASALFRERVHAAGADLADTSDASLAALLERLDHSPLAIELAAARSHVLSVDQLNEHLDDRFRILRDRHGERHPRHRSLYACLLTSWDRLEAPLKHALAALSVFPGAFHPRTAECLLDALGDSEELAVDLLDDLRRAALLHREGGDAAHASLKLLDSVADLVRGQDEVADTRRRARTALVPSLVKRARTLARAGGAGPELVSVAALLTDALDEVVDPARIVDVLSFLGRWLRERGPLDVGRRAVERALRKLDTLDDAQQARLHLARLELVVDWSVDISPIVADALAAARRAGDEDLETLARLHEAETAMSRGHASVDVTTSRAWMDAASDPDVIARAARHTASLLHRAGHHGEGLELLEGALALAPQGASRADLLNEYGLCLAVMGRIDAAAEAMRESIDVFRALGWRRRQAVMLSNLAGELVLRGRRQTARAYLAEALEVMRRIGDRRAECAVRANLALQELFDWDGEAAEANLHVAVAIAEEQSLDGILVVLHHNLSTAAWLLGDLPAALARAEKGQELADRLENRRHACFLAGWRSALLSALGRQDEAEAAWEEARGLQPDDDKLVDEVIDVLALHVQAGRDGPAPELPGEVAGPRGELLVELLRRRLQDDAP